MKVQVFEEHTDFSLQKEVNTFLQKAVQCDVEIVDIKLSATPTHIVAMVIYKGELNG